MLIKVLHQEIGSRKLIAEFPIKAFELIPTVFIVLELAFSVLILKDEKISRHRKRSSLKFYTQCLNEC